MTRNQFTFTILYDSTMSTFNKDKQTPEQKKIRTRLNALEGRLCAVTPSKLQMELICLIALLGQYLRDPDFVVSDLQDTLMHRYPKSYSWNEFVKAFDSYRTIVKEAGGEILFQPTQRTVVA
jgi:hypothetical protein